MLSNLLTEGHQGQQCQLEMLQSEGDAYDGDAEEQSYKGMAHSHLDAAKDDPQDVEAHRQAAHLALLVLDGATEGVERQARHLEQLQAYGDTYDGDAIHYSQHEICDREEKASEHYPHEIS